MADGRDYAGEAALDLLESLLIHLSENGSLSDADRDAIFEAVVEAHRNAFAEDGDHRHTAIIERLETLQAGAIGPLLR